MHPVLPRPPLHASPSPGRVVVSCAPLLSLVCCVYFFAFVVAPRVWCCIISLPSACTLSFLASPRFLPLLCFGVISTPLHLSLSTFVWCSVFLTYPGTVFSLPVCKLSSFSSLFYSAFLSCSCASLSPSSPKPQISPPWLFSRTLFSLPACTHSSLCAVLPPCAVVGCECADMMIRTASG